MSAAWKSWHWIAFGLVAAWLSVYSVRHSMDEFSHLTNLDLHYLPHSFTPFSNVPSLFFVYKNEPAVQFRGVSEYLRERAKKGPGAHCTCGRPSDLKAAVIAGWPVLLHAIGLILLAKGPGDPRRWIFLGLLIAFGHWTLPAGHWNYERLPVYGGFFRLADVREWEGWMRVPALVQQTFLDWCWPGLLILYLRPPESSRLWTTVVSMPWFAFAGAQTVVAVAWSENYLPWRPLYRLVQQHPTELFVGGMLLAVITFATVSTRQAWLGVLFAVLATAGSLWAMMLLPAAPRFVGVEAAVLKPMMEVPWQFWHPIYLIPFSLAGFWCSAWLCGWRRRELRALAPLLIVSVTGMAVWIRAMEGADWLRPMGWMGYPEWPFWLASVWAVVYGAPRRDVDDFESMS